MKVLVACEFSGVVRDAFARHGHDAWSCDLLPTEAAGQHIQGDVLAHLDRGWDLIVAHPPCTFLSRAGARWWAQPGRAEKAHDAAEFVKALWAAPVKRVAIENPIGQLNKLWRAPSQVIEPWWFGDPYTKRTCLWLRGLPPLMATQLVGETRAWLPSNTGKGRRAGQRSAPGVAHTAKDASRTFRGIAEAMAEQWGHP